MFIPPQAEGWSGVEGGESRCFLTKSSIRVPLIHNSLRALPHSPYAGPSSLSLPKPSSPPIESATAYQRRLKDSEHVPRPRNAFIIYRCEFTNKYLASGGSERASDTGNRSLSKRAGEAWKNEKPEIIQYYRKLADEERARHRTAHPDYRFRPKRKKSAGQTGGTRSPKRRASSPYSKRSAGRPPSVSSVERDKLSQNDPLQIKTITIPTSSSTLSQPYLSRQPTPDFSHEYGSTTPTSPCSPLTPVDDILCMPRPTIPADHPDSLLSYSADDSQVGDLPYLPCSASLTIASVLWISQGPSPVLLRRLLLVRPIILCARSNATARLPPTCCRCLFAGRMGWQWSGTKG